MEFKKGYGYIYLVTSPSGKQYIGQVVDYLRNGEQKGVERRWKQHVTSALRNSKRGCVYLNQAIRKYGPDNFTVSGIVHTPIENLDNYEQLFIEAFNTLAPNGYNLQTGGTNTKHSEETCKKRSESLKKLLQNPEKRKLWSDVKKGVQQTKRRHRKRATENNLPKYILHYKSGKYEGYEVNSHPLCKSKKFTKSKYTMAERLQMAIDFINSLETT